MSPSPRAALLLALVAATALVVPIPIVAAAALALATATLVDALAARRPLQTVRTIATDVARGVAMPLRVEVSAPPAVTVRVRQPRAPDLQVEPAEGDAGLAGTVTANRRGRHILPPVTARATGPLGLGRWDHQSEDAVEIRSHPDLPAARRIATSVRQGHFRDPGIRRGVLGLGTNFDSVRDYTPDDDVRRINWPATERVGRPMANQYREDTERDVWCVVDTGRLMTAPVGDRTRLDIALDAVAALAAVADAVGDRVGAMAFDTQVRRSVPPRRRGAARVLRALYDLEPEPLDSDYDLAFFRLGAAKRALVVVFTDLLDESASRPLLDAVPVLARRHAVVVATVSDPDLAEAVTTEPVTLVDVHAATIASALLADRDRVVGAMAGTATIVVDTPERFPSACVAAYLTLKSRARL